MLETMGRIRVFLRGLVVPGLAGLVALTSSGAQAAIKIIPTQSADALANAVVAGGGGSLTVTGATLQGNAIQNNVATASTATYTTPDIYSMTTGGIVLSTGRAVDYGTGPNTVPGFTTSFGTVETPAQASLLVPITGQYVHYDVTQLDITFSVGNTSNVYFQVVFGSEEYPEFVGSPFKDGFGLFLNGQNIAYSGGKPINIDHPDMVVFPGTELDGVLAPGGNPVLLFKGNVIPGSTGNTLTFIVADTADTILDTTVYVTALGGALPPNLFHVDAVTPPYGKVGTTRTVEIQGQGFEDGKNGKTSFDFGAGITVDPVDTFINSPNSATVKITIAGDAALGFRDVTAVQNQSPGAYTSTLSDGFRVVDVIQDVSISKTHVGDFRAGLDGAFTITVKNLSGGPIAGATTVTDALPRGLTYVSGTGTGWICNAVGSLVTCDHAGGLATDEETVLTLTVAVDLRAAPGVSNTASVALPGDLDPSNDSSTDLVKVLSGIDLAIFKSHVGNFTVGTNGLFTLRVKNVGTSPTLPPFPLAVGSIANSRFQTDWTLDGSRMAQTRAKLLNGANFGAGGTIPRAIVISDVSAPLTAAVLDPYDVFFIGYLFDTAPAAFSDAELAAMRDYVLAGGTMVVSCDDPRYDNVCGTFGYPVLAASPNPLHPTPFGLDHPIFHGPFGDVTSFDGSQTIGYFFDASGADVLARDSSERPVMLEKSFGSGRVILISDVDFIAQATTAGSGITSQNDRLLGNLFAYVARFNPIVVTDTLPAGLTYVSASGSGWTCSGGGSSVTCSSPGPLAPGQYSDIFLTASVAAAAAPTATNRGTVSLQDDSNELNDFATDTVTIGGSNPTPSVNSITPNFGPVAGLTAVTISGSNFASGAAVLFDGLYASSVVVVDAATITCLTPAHAAGAVNVVVVNPSAQSASLDSGYTYVTVTATSGYYTVTPCRSVDTRDPAGPFGGPALSPGSRTFALGGRCGIPADAKAVSANVTAVSPTAAGDLRVFPSGNAPSAASTLNFGAGQTRANNSLLGLGAAGSVDVIADVPAAQTVHLIIDVNGYFK